MAIKIPIVTEFKNKGVKDAERTLAQFGKSIGVAFAAVTATFAAAGIAVARFGSDAIKAAEGVEQANNRLEQVNKSMGLFGSETAGVTDRLIKFAEANELSVAVDAEVIKATQAKLLTFKELGKTADEAGGAFDRATMAALDLAAAGFGSAETNAVQLGKALQDPIKGITALARAGVTFTAQEKDKIKALVESGKTLEAQNLILQSIETQVGGTAQATAKASDKMKLAFDNVKESVGAALLPSFQDLTNEVVKLTPEIEKALVPIAEELAIIFRNEVLPAIQDFTKWLASPQGTKAVRDFVLSIIDGIREFAKFTGEVIKNKDEIIRNVGFAVSLAVAIRTITTVTNASRAAMLLFNVALKANPIGMLITALGIAAVAVVTFTKEVTEAEKAVKKKTNNTIKLRQEQIQLMEKIKQGGIEVNAYRKRLIAVGDELMQVKTGLSTSAGEANRFSNALKNALPNLSKYRSQLGDTRVDAQRLVEAQRELAYYMNGGKPGTYKPLGATPPGGGGGGGKTPAQEAAEAFKAVSKLIKDSREKVLKAEGDYRKAVSAANREYLENEKKIRADFAQKVADIIQQSKDRIRDAFRSVAGFGIGSFLNIFKTAEDERKRAFEDAQKAAKDAGEAFTQSFVAADPLKAFLDSLRNKVEQNKRTLEVSAKLLEAGFSQSFIEQIITTGEDGGLALAEGLLGSNPAIIKEVQDLYKNIETIAETGADNLANNLYEKQGLASRQLNELLAKTQNDLLDALDKNYTDYLSSLDTAAEALREAIQSIREDFDDEIEAMNGQLGGLTAAIAAFKKMLGEKVEQTIVQPQPRPQAIAGASAIETTASQVKNATGIIVDSADDLAGVFSYLNERIAGAKTYLSKDLAAAQRSSAEQTLSALIAQRSQLSDAVTRGNAVGTVINVNVKTSSDQSLAMVGKTLGNTITKYVTTGGQVLVSSGSPV